jgi:putative membrane protein
MGTGPTRGRVQSDRSLALVVSIASAVAVAALCWILYLHEPAGDARALAFMPAVNAAFNTLSATLIATGVAAIKTKRTELHRALMLSALASSTCFLVGYVAYHYVHGDTHYPEGAPLRSLYLAILASHVLLSIVALPMVLATAWLGLTSGHPRHRKIARFTYPIWLYVSVTGVVVFVMLRSAVG